MKTKCILLPSKTPIEICMQNEFFRMKTNSELLILSMSQGTFVSTKQERFDHIVLTMFIHFRYLLSDGCRKDLQVHDVHQGLLSVDNNHTVHGQLDHHRFRHLLSVWRRFLKQHCTVPFTSRDFNCLGTWVSSLDGVSAQVPVPK
jgi:hypothetical protein